MTGRGKFIASAAEIGPICKFTCFPKGRHYRLGHERIFFCCVLTPADAEERITGPDRCLPSCIDRS
jgi:hypothetical protein